MGIRINIQRNLQYLTDNKASVEVSGSTVGECLDELVKLFPGMEKGLSNKKKSLLDYVEIFVNGKSAYPKESETPVKDGDEIFLALMIAGG